MRLSLAVRERRRRLFQAKRACFVGLAAHAVGTVGLLQLVRERRSGCGTADECQPCGARSDEARLLSRRTLFVAILLSKGSSNAAQLI